MTAINTAAKKPVTKAQRIRNNAAKAIARADKAALQLSIEEAIAKAVYGTQQGEASCRVLAFALEREFGNDWHLWDSGNMRSDNEKAVYARLDTHRKNCRDLALAKGLSNLTKPWSDAKKAQRDKNNGGRPAERIKKPLDGRIHEATRKLYQAGMKEEKQTEQEMAMMDALGRFLIQYFKEDLSKLG